MSPRILVVDDDGLILDCFRHAFSEDRFELQFATSGAAALAQFQQQPSDVVITDVHLPDATGLDVLTKLHAFNSRVPVILMTGHGSTNLAIEATRLGAFDYLLKPLDLDLLQSTLDRALAASCIPSVPQSAAAPNESDRQDTLIGQCPAMQDVYRRIGRVAEQDITVLILGESGTGKEIVARAIHQYSKRFQKPFVAINCAAIPEALLESELFGHEKGSFTGAERQRIGKFEQCNGGTLFLDEVGDMTPLTQTKVLRVLQDQQFERVGGNETIQTSVRLIAATNRDLRAMMECGTFRSDLYYRLSVYTIHLPPLRERGGDIPLLVHYFLEQFSRKLDKQVQQVSPDVMELLEAYPWPGNLRELQSVIQHVVVEATCPVVVSEFLPAHLRNWAGTTRPQPADSDGFDAELIRVIRQRIRAGANNLHEELTQRAERVLFTELLQSVDGNITRASAILGISRSTLRAKLVTLGIHLDRSVRMND